MRTIRHEVSAGTSIDQACREALALSRESGATVAFDFNDVPMTVAWPASPSKLVQGYFDELDRRAKAYRESPKGIAEAEKRKAQIEQLNRECGELLACLDRVLTTTGTDAKMDWLKRFTLVADDVSVKFDTGALADKLEAGGFKENEFVGNPPGWFCTKDRMARYIAGQVINFLRRGCPPHPVTVSFIKKYESLKAKTPGASVA